MASVFGNISGLLLQLMDKIKISLWFIFLDVIVIGEIYIFYQRDLRKEFPNEKIRDEIQKIQTSYDRYKN